MQDSQEPAPQEPARSDPGQTSTFRLFLQTCLPMRPFLLLMATLGLYLAVLVPRLLNVSYTDGIWAGSLHLWGDWPFHIAMVQRFGRCAPSQWLTQPMIAGEPLRYPFFSSFLSGMLLRLGCSMQTAILLPTFVLFMLLLPGMLALYRLLIGGRYRAVLGVLLFFCAGGPGYRAWLGDLWQSHSLDLLLNPPRDYSGVDKFEWYSSNFLSAMLLPQRAFLVGLTVSVWVLALVLFTFRYWETLRPRLRWRLLLIGGLLGGVLPVMHMHSWFAVAVISLFLVVPFAGRRWDRWRPLLIAYIVPGLILAGVMYKLFLAPVRHYPDFVSWRPGLNAHDDGLLVWLEMWWQFWGIALPAAVAGMLPLLLRMREDRWRVGFFAGGFALFTIANLVQFQPIPWDNSKLFLWVYLVLSGILAEVVADLWRAGPGLLRRLLYPLGSRWECRLVTAAAAIALFSMLTATGTLELIRLQRIDKNRALILNGNELPLGDYTRTHTPEDAVFLTGTDVSTWPMVWGARPIFLGFTGWMSNFAFPYEERERDLKAMFLGGPIADFLLGKDAIDYVAIGPGERGYFHANVPWYRKHFPVFLDQSGWTVFAVSSRAIALLPPAARNPKAAGSQGAGG